MTASRLKGPSIALALTLLSGVLVLGQDPLVRVPAAPGPHPLQSLGRPAANATAERPGFDILVWRRDFTNLSSAEYRGARPGTDVVLQGKADAMEALLALDADTLPSSIVLSLAADRGLTLGVDGAATGLVAGVPVRVSASFYQSRDGGLARVAGGLVVSGTQIVLWSERSAAREPLIVSVRATFGTNPDAISAVAAFGSVPLTATVQVDADGNAVASPGDTLRYRLTIPNVGDTAMSNVSANLPLDANTAAVAGSLNVSPIALDQAVSTNEDTALPITLTGSDADGNALTYTVVTQPAHGVVVQAAPGSAGVTYTPAANYSGADSFTVRNNDGRVDSNEVATISVTVSPVNDAPSFTKGADVTVLEDSGAQTVAGWATAISKGPADESGQTLTFVVTNNTNAALFLVGPAVNATNGNLTFTPAANAHGTATITLRLDDNGGGANQSPAQTFAITLTNVNDAPSFTKGTDQTVLEDSGAQTVAGWATAINPGPNEGSQTVTFEVTGNNNPGLFAVAPAVASNGTLTYTPAANANGSATITLRARDDGGTANLGVDVSPAQTFVINVTAVNDTPSFTKGADVTVLEDSGANTVAGWATAISKGGGADESGQTLTFVVTNNTNPALFATAPAVNAANGNLTFTPEAQAFGTATITLRLDDNGGGANQSATQTFDITVTNVNDVPSFTKGADQTVLEDAGAQTVNPWATAISAGPNEGSQTVAFQITGNSNPTLFSAAPSVSPAGVLTYTPAANANGSATITLRITDNGGTADLGVDTSATQTFDITVTAVNDNPVADDEAYPPVAEGGALIAAAPGVLFGDTDVEGSSLTAQLVTGPAHASAFTLNPDGSFSYEHDGSETPLTDTFTYRAFDGALTSNLATVTITITPINDAPVAVGNAYGVNEGATLTVSAPGVLTGDSDAEGTTLTAVLFAGPAHATSFALNPDGSFSYVHNGSETTTDSFTYRASDGVALSNVATVTITITPVNDPPVIDLDGTTPGANYAFTFTEGDPATFLENAANAAITDADHTTLTSLTVTLTNRLDPGFEVLDVDLTGFPLFTKDYDITTDPAQGVLTIASATPQPIADYQTLLRRVTYGNTDLAPDPTSRIVTFVANDGTSDSAAATTTVTVVSLNTPPTVTAGATLGYTENQGPGVLDAGLTVSDPDNSSMASATVQITGNYASGQDVLGFVDQSGITGLWDSGSGTLTLTGSASIANYQAALRSVTYVNGSDNPSTAARTVTWIVNDGTDPSAPATSAVTVAAVDDNPVADDEAYGVNEGATLTVPAPGVLDGDTDAEGSALTAQLVTGPAHASSFTLNADGSFSYTHDGSETLTDTFTYRAFDGALLSNTATVTIAITPINDAPVASDNAYGVNEGATLTQVAPGVLAGDTDAEGTTLTAVLVTGPAHASSFALNPNGSFSYTHDGSETPLTDTFTYRASDGLALSNVATVTITITPVDDSPVIDLDGTTPGGDYVFTFTEGDPTTFAEDMADADITDADTTTLTSLTVTLTNRLDPGFEVLDVDLVTGGFDANFTKAYDITTNPAQGVLTITATTPQPIASFVTLLRRVTYSNPDPGPNPADRIVTFVANDGTSNSAAATTTITVITLNNAPVAVADGYGVNEGGTLAPVAPGVLGNDTDADGDTLTAILVAGPSHASSFTLNPDGSFTYVHDGDGFAADSFTYKANDGIVDSNTVTVTITVTSVNDVPSFVKGADVTVLEDSGLHTAAGWATAISAGGAEESAQVLTFNASNNNNALFSVQPAVATDGTLTFTPAANAFGTATVTLTLSDDGGILNGGDDTSDPQTFVITVTPVNDAPSFTKGADQTVLEDAAAQSVSGWATAISAGPNESGQTVAFEITINSNPSLFSVAPAVSPAGVLSYTLAGDANGTAAITLRITDNGGTSDGGVDVSATQTFNITVTPVNDAPSYTAGAAQTVLEDSGAQSVPGWATGMSPGPSNESGQALSFNVTNNTVPGTLTFTSGPSVALDGTLTYTPAPNAHGSGTFNVILSDNGGTANSGVDSVTHILTINVTPVNDAPTFTPGANQTANEDANAVSVSNFITAITPGPNETGQTVTFTITGNTNSSLFSVAPAISSTGTLTYTTAANQNGVTTISYHASDNGGTANSGVDTTSPDQSFTITLNPVNDAPVAAAKAFTAQANFQTAQSINLAANGTGDVTDVDNADGGFTTQDFTLTSVTPLGCATCVAAVSDGNLGTYTFEPAPGQTGTFLLQYVVTDNGNPTPGVASVPGTLTGQPGVITVTVNGPVVWFVDSTAPGGGNGTWTGTNAKAFQTIAQADAVNIPGDRVFVLNNNASPITYAGGLTMTPTERLIGQGVTGGSFDALVLGGTPPAGTAARPTTAGVRPVLQGTTTLENGVTVTGLNFTPSAAVPAMSASGLATTAAITIDQVIVSGAIGTRALSLTNVTATAAGALNVSNASFSNLSGAELFVSGGNIPITINSTVTITSNAGRSIDIQDRTAGTILFSTGITDTGQGIFLDDNVGTITFNGPLSLSTTTNTAFTATDGGTITTNSGVTNTISTSSGQPLLLRGIVGPQTWRSINVTGSATNGISVTNLTGAFTIAGTGAANSGGTITNVTNRGAEFITVSGAVALNNMNFNNAGSSDGPGGPGCQEPIGGNTATCNAAIFLSSTSGGVSLNSIHIDGGAQVGINGLNVTNLTMNNVEVENVGNDSLENGVLLKNTFGSGSIANSTFHNNVGKQVYMYNNTGTLTSFNIIDSNFSDTAAPNGAQGLLVYADGSSTVMTVNTGTGPSDGNTFSNLFSFAWQALAANDAQLTANLRNATITNTGPMVVQASLNSHIDTLIDSANWTAGANTAAGPLSLKTDGGGDMDAVVTNNLLGQNGVVGSGTPASCGNCPGMFINPRFDSDSTFDIRGNTIQQITGSGITFQPGESDADNAVNVTITGNLIRGPMTNVPQAIVVTNGVTSGPPADNTCMRLTLGGSVTPGAWPSLTAGAKNRIENDWSSDIAGGEVFLFQRFSTVFNLAGYPGTGVGAYVQTQNVITSVTGVQASSIGTFTNGSCFP